jgi:superfamily II DNA or RNA helicase
MKLAPKVKVDGYQIVWQPSYNPNLNDAIKVYPGVRWDSKQRAWKVPIDLAPYIESEAKLQGQRFPVLDSQALFPPTLENPYYNRLHGYQQESVNKILVDRRHLLAYETGLGKTPPAIVAADITGAKRILVMCPGTMRHTWVRQFEAWTGKQRKAIIIEHGKDWAKLEDDHELIVTTYHLVKKAGALTGLDFLIADEGHHIKNARAAISQAALDVRLMNPTSYAVLLTATPIANEPTDAWHQLHWLWPNRFGTFFQFAQRYSNVVWNGYGNDIGGINEDVGLQNELRYRLSVCASRATKLEFAHLLPPLRVSTIRIPYDRKVAFRTLEDKWSDSSQAHLYRLEDALMKASDAKLDTVKAHVKNQLELYDHVVVFTYRRDYAAAIAEVCDDRICKVITGDIVASKRDVELEVCRQAPKSLVCATMDSVGEGLDLTYCHLAVFAELTYKPKTLNQAIGRFCRLSGTHGVDVHFVILESTVDEQVALVVLHKIEAANAVLKAGKAETELQSALGVSEDDEGFLARIREVANEMEENDPYM